MGKQLIRIIAILLICGLTLYSFEAFCASTSDLSLNEMSFEQLNTLELNADHARHLFWRGDYQNAIKEFSHCNECNNVSTPLYLNERALCYLALGDFSSAERDLLSSIRFVDAYNNINLEKNALSNFGKEEEKIYFGDPYERANGYFLLALLLMDKGDYDNALAACKSGLLADSDATENRYDSDITLLHLIEAKCHLLRGNADTAKIAFENSMNSYRVTSPEVRSFFSERLNQLEILKLSERDRSKMKIDDSDDDIHRKIIELDQQIKSASQNIFPEKDLEKFFSGRYNTLIVIPQGKGPDKIRTGKNANVVVFDCCKKSGQLPEITLDGKNLSDLALAAIEDVNFQATTRGGRHMDAILRGKVAFRDTTEGVGTILANVGGCVGLAGIFIQGIAGAMSPEADTRVWGTLPSKFKLYALDLPLGEHKVTSKEYVYFENINTVERKIAIKSKNDFAVVFVPPFPMDIYSPQALCKVKRRRKRKKTAKNIPISILIPPPLGFNMIERYILQGDEKKATAFAPNLKRIDRCLVKLLKKNGIRTKCLEHSEIIKDRELCATQAPLALQIQLANLDFQKSDDDAVFSSYFYFTLIQSTTGNILLKEKMEGSCSRNENDKAFNATNAFYKCLEMAFSKFITSPVFKEALNNNKLIALSHK